MKAFIKDTSTGKKIEINRIHTLDIYNGKVTFYNRSRDKIVTVVADHTKMIMVEK